MYGCVQLKRWQGHPFRALGRPYMDFVLSPKSNGKLLDGFKCNEWDRNPFLKDDPVAGKLLDKEDFAFSFWWSSECLE